MPVTSSTSIHIEGEVPADVADLGAHGLSIRIGGYQYALTGSPEDLQRWLVNTDAAVQKAISRRLVDEENGCFEWVDVQSLHEGDTVHLDPQGWITVTSLRHDGISNELDWAGYRENGTGVILHGSLELAHAIRRRTSTPADAAQVA